MLLDSWYGANEGVVPASSTPVSGVLLAIIKHAVALIGPGTQHNRRLINIARRVDPDDKPRRGDYGMQR